MIQIALFAIAGMMLAVFVGNMRREIGIWIALVTGFRSNESADVFG